MNTRTKVIAIFIALIALTGITGTGIAHAQNAAPHAIAKHDKKSEANKPKSKPKKCKNDLVLTLKKVGFKGEDLHEAWAIAMRESHGHETSISHTHDYGLFQFNRAAHSRQPWWSKKKLLKADYNATVAYRMSRGGKTWYPWGLDGHGQTKAAVYISAGWSKDQIASHITKPYRKYYIEFNSLPKSCR